MLRGEYERSPLALVPVTVRGEPPAPFVLGGERGLAPAAAREPGAAEGQA